MESLKQKIRQAQQNFDYADQDYIDAAIFEMNAVNEKFRAMLREKRREKNVRSKGKRTFSLFRSN